MIQERKDWENQCWDPDPLVRGTDPDPPQKVTGPQHWEGRTECCPGRQPLGHIPEDADGLNTGPQRSLNKTSYCEKSITINTELW
jgi:hypothetical protein